MATAGPYNTPPQTALNITTTTVIKPAPGMVLSFGVTVAGSAAGSINDCATTGAVAASNAVCATPNAVGYTQINAQCYAGVCVAPGSGQTITITYQ